MRASTWLIDLLALQRPAPKETLDALRYVGNFGSHEGDADFNDLLECFKLLEYAMTELIDRRQERFAETASRIIARKGKPVIKG